MTKYYYISLALIFLFGVEMAFLFEVGLTSYKFWIATLTAVAYGAFMHLDGETKNDKN